MHYAVSLLLTFLHLIISSSQYSLHLSATLLLSVNVLPFLSSIIVALVVCPLVSFFTMSKAFFVLFFVISVCRVSHCWLIHVSLSSRSFVLTSLFALLYSSASAGQFFRLPFFSLRLSQRSNASFDIQGCFLFLCFQVLPAPLQLLQH